MKKCQICNKTDMKTEHYCELCASIISASYTNYSSAQLMALYSHIIGLVIVKEIQEATMAGLKDQYDSETLKKEGRLN